MNRRENLKLLLTGSLGTGWILSSCTPEDKAADLSPKIMGTPGGRVPEEVAIDNKLLSEKFFTEQEMAMLTILVDIVLPRDEVSTSASEARVPDFIEFMMKDQPANQTPFRGGLMWINHRAFELFNKTFTELSEQERLQLIDEIAWPEKASKEVENGVKFFNMLRNLTITGFYTSEAGFKDIGYIGNAPNVWDGVPQEVMDQYGLALDQKYLDVYLRSDERGNVAEWDEQGNLKR